MLPYKRFDSVYGVDEIPGKNRMGNLATEYEQGNAGGLHCRELIRLVANALVVRYNRPSSLADFDNPLFVFRMIYEVIGMPLNRNPCVLKNRRELFAEIAIRKEGCQAARS